MKILNQYLHSLIPFKTRKVKIMDIIITQQSNWSAVSCHIYRNAVMLNNILDIFVITIKEEP